MEAIEERRKSYAKHGVPVEDVVDALFQNANIMNELDREKNTTRLRGKAMGFRSSARALREWAEKNGVTHLRSSKDLPVIHRVGRATHQVIDDMVTRGISVRLLTDGVYLKTLQWIYGSNQAGKSKTAATSRRSPKSVKSSSKSSAKSPRKSSASAKSPRKSSAKTSVQVYV